MNANGLRILIVDDEKANLRMLSALLRDEAAISMANNGGDAIKKARELQPDLILLDVLMAQVSGFEVMQQLKGSELTRAIPVIFITALGDVRSEERAFELGACDYIHKPFHAAIVVARVSLHLQLARQRIMLEELANVDPLTTVANRRRYQEVFDYEWLAGQREQSEFAMAMIDVDHFKLYNDTYGHAAGDQVLYRIAQTLKAQLRRPRDLVARYGGEEFVLISVGTDQKGLEAIINNCMEAIARLNISHSESDHQRVTVSIGVVVCIPSADMEKQALATRADQLLYEAKAAGRNCAKWSSLVSPLCRQAMARSTAVR